MKKEYTVKVTVDFDENEQTEKEVKEKLIGNLDFAGWKAEIVDDGLTVR